MTNELLENLSTGLEHPTQLETQQISYSVGVMAYNEEANIKRTLQAILEQKSQKTHVAEVIVVASGCTDNTVPLIKEVMQYDSRIRLIVQKRREGKASAINLFLEEAKSALLVLVGADTIPERDALERLCACFADPTVGMVGAHPIPVNDQYTFIGHAVHMLWQLHDSLARQSPKLGEVVAFRNVVESIPSGTAVDELSLQARIATCGLRMVYVPEAIVYNKGPMTIGDFLKQRRRIYAGHLAIRSQEHFEAPTMKVGSIFRALLTNAPDTISTPQLACWTAGTIALEGLARLQGRYDVLRHRSHAVWQIVPSTKTVEDEQGQLRRISKTKSVITFHVVWEQVEGSDIRQRSNTRHTFQVLRSLLPLLRKQLLHAEKSEAELIAMRLKAVIEAQQIPLGKGLTGFLRVQYHAASFAEEAG
jgi:poly-beta-1,6-N-acetyl-D-glucosamine synthase